MKNLKNITKKLIKRSYITLPNQVKLILLPYISKSTRLKEILGNQKFIGRFPIQVNSENKFEIISKGGLIENDIYWNGLFNSWESDVGWIWIELSKFSEFVFDIGANIGIYSLVTKSINPSSKVFAFEPSVHHFPNLVENNKINHFDIICNKLALSNFSGEQIFYDLPHPHSNTASLSPDKMKNWSGYNGEINEYKIETLTLIDYVKSNNIPRIDLIKIDVELHEPEVIEGLGIYLEKYRPILIIEVLSNEVANKLNKLINIQDFKIFHLEKKGEQKQMLNFNIENNKNGTWEWNFLVFHKSLEEKIKKHTTLYKQH